MIVTDFFGSISVRAWSNGALLRIEAVSLGGGRRGQTNEVCQVDFPVIDGRVIENGQSRS